MNLDNDEVIDVSITRWTYSKSYNVIANFRFSVLFMYITSTTILCVPVICIWIQKTVKIIMKNIPFLTFFSIIILLTE